MQENKFFLKKIVKFADSCRCKLMRQTDWTTYFTLHVRMELEATI